MPGSIAAGPGSIWVANVGDKTVSHVDPFTRSLIKTISVGATPDSVAVGPGAVWVLHGFVGLLTRIDPDVNRVSRTISATRHSLAGAGGAVTVGGGAVWAAFSSADVAKIDPISNRRVAKDYAGRSPDGAAFGEGSLWIANHSENTVDRFDPRTFGTGATAVIKVGRGPGGIAVGGGFVWVSNTDDDSISRIDPSTQSVTSIPVGRAPRGVAYGAGAVWVADSGDGTIKRIDPRSARVEATIHLGNSPSAIAVATCSSRWNLIVLAIGRYEFLAQGRRRPGLQFGGQRFLSGHLP